MTYETIAVAVQDAALTITLDRPEKLNAATPVMLDELIDAVAVADADDDVRAIIVTGRGRAFCAGADLIEDRPDLRSVDRDAYRDGGGRVTLALFDCRTPLIAAVNGAAVGFGLTMTLPMDFRLAATGARFALPFARRGIVPEGCSSWFLPRVVGMGHALDWVTTGRMFSAAEALETGLLHSVHYEDELLPAARRLAAAIIEHTAPVSVAIARRMLWAMQGAAHPREAHLLESRMLYDRTLAADSDEGMDAFLEKRQAAFPGRVSTDLPADLA